jgi:phosphoglucosamine mutase
MNIGRAAAMVVAEEIGRRPTVIIGKDTRVSSAMLECAMAAGLCSVGADVILAGVVPTPAVAYLVMEHHADAGIMLSASHNSYEYNGIKIFGAGGRKLSDEKEFELEGIVLDNTRPHPIRWGWEVGRVTCDSQLAEAYISHIAATTADGLSGLRVAVDCSNGSAAGTAAKLFTRLGAEAEILNDKPSGININRDCGSTHIDALAAYVKDRGFDAGIAFDGDADRCLAVDELGNVLSGDTIMAMLAACLKERGLLRENTIVATVYSNLGLTRFAQENGMRVEITKAGDRYVLDKMLGKGYNLGGEQSGHVILSDHMPTGDGQLTAVQLLATLKRSGKKLSELASVMTVYPQVLTGFRADAAMKSLLSVDKGAEKVINEAKAQLGAEGRILVRASGTEPLIRVMIEGRDKAMIAQLAQEAAEKIEESLTQNEEYKRLGGF